MNRLILKYFKMLNRNLIFTRRFEHFLKHLSPILTSLIILIGNNLYSQEKSTEVNFNIFGAMDEAKDILRDTETGKMLELLQNSFREKNIKLKMLFDDDGLVLMMKMLRIGNNLVVQNTLLASSDVDTILNFIIVAERLGCEVPTGLENKLKTALNSSIGKTWKEFIKTLKQVK